MLRRHSENADRTAKAVDSFATAPDEATARIQDAAAALAPAPSTAPRESFRAALRAQIIREAERIREPRDGAGTRDGELAETPPVVVLTEAGQVVLADLEGVPETDAADAASKVAKIVEQHRAQSQI